MSHEKITRQLFASIQGKLDGHIYNFFKTTRMLLSKEFYKNLDFKKCMLIRDLLTSYFLMNLFPRFISISDVYGWIWQNIQSICLTLFMQKKKFQHLHRKYKFKCVKAINDCDFKARSSHGALGVLQKFGLENKSKCFEK